MDNELGSSGQYLYFMDYRLASSPVVEFSWISDPVIHIIRAAAHIVCATAHIICTTDLDIHRYAYRGGVIGVMHIGIHTLGPPRII